MRRLLLLLSLLPLLAAIIFRKINSDRPLSYIQKTQLNIKAEELARKLLDSIDHQNVIVKTTKRSWPGAAVTGDGWLNLPNIDDSNSAQAHGRAALRVGLYLVAQRNPKAASRRRWALRFGHVFPIFCTIVIVFALVLAKLSPLWALSIVIGSLGLAACAQILTVTTELQAASMVCLLLEKKRIFPRLSDEEAVITATRAWAWHSVLPGILSRLI